MIAPFFTVVLPTYNRSKTLSRATDSVINQSFSDFELIIIDDGSTDNTQDILKSFTDKRIRIITQKNQGVSAARNMGILNANGSWITLLDSDDYWAIDKLQKQFQFIRGFPEYKIHQSKEIWIRNGKKVNPTKSYTKQSGNLFFQSLQLCAISPSSVCIHRELFQKYGIFDEFLPACEDYDLWLRISKSEQIGLIDEYLINKTGGHEDQLSMKFPAMDRFRIYSMLKLLKSNSLNIDQTDKLKETLQKKTDVLILGSLKRGRNLKSLAKSIEKALKSRNYLIANWDQIKESLLNWIDP